MVLYYLSVSAKEKTIIFDGTDGKFGIERIPGWIALQKRVNTVALTYHDYHYNDLELDDEKVEQK